MDNPEKLTAGYDTGRRQTKLTAGYDTGQRQTKLTVGYDTGRRQTKLTAGYDTGRRQTKQKTQRIKLNKMTNTDLTKNQNEPRCSRRVRSSCFL